MRSQLFHFCFHFVYKTCRECWIFGVLNISLYSDVTSLKCLIFSPFLIYYRSKLEIRRMSKIKFQIRAVIYREDRENFELTKNMTNEQFKNGTAFDEFWFDKMKRYAAEVCEKLYEEDIPFNSQLLFETATKTVPIPGRRGREGGLEGNPHSRRTTVRREFVMTIIFAQDDMPFDI